MSNAAPLLRRDDTFSVMAGEIEGGVKRRVRARWKETAPAGMICAIAIKSSASNVLMV